MQICKSVRHTRNKHSIDLQQIKNEFFFHLAGGGCIPIPLYPPMILMSKRTEQRGMQCKTELTIIKARIKLEKKQKNQFSVKDGDELNREQRDRHLSK